MRIAFLGACGTGKTTLVEAMYKDLGLKPVYNNARNVMAGLGITDLTDVENTKRALLCESILITRLTKQLGLIDEGFISDRSIIDELMYWELDNEKNFPSLTTTLKDFVYSFLNKFKENKLVDKAFYGLRPAVCGLISAATFDIICVSLLNLDFSGNILSLFKIKEIILFAVLFVLIRKLKVHPIVFILASAVVGVIFL